MAFLNRVGLDREALPEQLTQDAAVARAVRELDRAGLSELEREVYEREVMKKMVDAIQIKTAKQEGRQDGRQETLVQLLVRQMTRRLGEVPAAVLSRLERMSADILDDLDLALPDLHTYADVEQWLTRS